MVSALTHAIGIGESMGLQWALSVPTQVDAVEEILNTRVLTKGCE